jgi:regulator of RNase E activity RraA
MKSLTGYAANSADLDLFTEIDDLLYTAVISDCLDELGYRDQAMDETVRPLSPDDRFCGWARTISYMDVCCVAENPYEREIEAVDSILPGEVVVIGTGRSRRNAPWGELMSTAARARGARGAVVDGLVRDVKKIQELGFPVFARGIKPVDSKGRGIVVEHNAPVEVAGVVVRPGDLIVADYDGVVVAPRSVLPETIQLARDKVARENRSREELKNGAYLQEVYRKYGVL